jgi:hypothetical protein
MREIGKVCYKNVAVCGIIRFVCSDFGLRIRFIPSACFGIATISIVVCIKSMKSTPNICEALILAILLRVPVVFAIFAYSVQSSRVDCYRLDRLA